MADSLNRHNWVVISRSSIPETLPPGAYHYSLFAGMDIYKPQEMSSVEEERHYSWERDQEVEELETQLADMEKEWGAETTENDAWNDDICNENAAARGFIAHALDLVNEAASYEEIAEQLREAVEQLDAMEGQAKADRAKRLEAKKKKDKEDKP